MKLVTDNKAKLKFKSYSASVKKKIAQLRKLILEAAEELGSIEKLEETLKWGELSYISKQGSTIRIDWKDRDPSYYAIYFKCTSKLVPTFKEVYGNTFNYENTRAILFTAQDEIPEKELKECIKAALLYHKVKNEPLLGMR